VFHKLLTVSRLPKTILIVDDEKNLLELVSGLLKPEGYDVLKAESGYECLEILKTKKPDLIILDIMMPRMSGEETAVKIREDSSNKKIKIIFLTVVSFPELGISDLNEIGVSEFIRKPFNNNEFIDKVRTVIS
jgi:CheY-like chemotaxis protein